LPLAAPRIGDLSDPVEVDRIRADAATLYAALKNAREVRPRAQPRRDMATLVRAWQSSQQFKATKPITQRGYQHYAKVILKWCKSVGDPDPTRITVPMIEQFIGLHDDKPQDRYHLRQVLWMVMKQAVRLRWRPDNPVAEVRVRQPKTRVTLWTRPDLDAHIEAARQAGRPEVAGILQLAWETGQRPTDVILFRHGVEYSASDGCFRFHQSKTGAYVTVPISTALTEVIAAVKREDSPYVFHDSRTGRPFRDANRLSHAFAASRPPTGGRLKLRALRHTCVVEMARAGCDIPEIASITGHSLVSAHVILQTYLPRDSELAERAQRKRGLI
jgi:hypothetical protein